MFGDPVGYSYAPPEQVETPIVFESDSEFAEAVRKLAPAQAWAIMDELMDAVKVLLPRLYDGVIRKLRAED